MDDYQITQSEEANLRNPKNRFLGCFCHANEVDDQWGCGCPFSVGVIIFAIITGLQVLADIPFYIAISELLIFRYINVFTCFFFVRLVSDIFATLGIIYSLVSIIRSHYKSSISAYYCIIVNFVLNTVYCVYFLYETIAYKRGGYIIWNISFFVYEFFLVLYCWFLFCNMVTIGRKNRENTACNKFV